MRHLPMDNILMVAIIKAAKAKGMKDEDVMDWFSSGNGEDCLMMVRLPHGMKEAVETAATEACGVCEKKDSCEGAEFIPNDFITSLIRLGLVMLANEMLYKGR